MKKMLALGLLSLSLAQAKVFVGVDGGYVMESGAISGKALDSGVWNGQYENAWSVSVNFGYERLFNNYFGTRIFVSAGYGSNFAGSLRSTSLNVDANIDALLNFVNTGSFAFGIFAGAGAGYQYNPLNNNWSLYSHNIPVFARAGLTFGFGEKVRLDLTAKMPIIAWDASDFSGATQLYSPLTLQAGIKFLF